MGAKVPSSSMGEQFRPSSDGASLWKTCVQEVLEERKGWEAEESR